MQYCQTSSRTKPVGSPRVYFYKDNLSINWAMALNLEHALTAGLFVCLKKKKRNTKEKTTKKS